MFKDLVDDLDDDPQEPERFLDVPFVPTDGDVVKAMLRLAEVGPKDMIYDLGSGDGRILITAAQAYKARGIGVEMDPVRIADAMESAGEARVEYLVDFIEEDIFTADFSEATVVTLYLLDSVNVQLRPRLLGELRPGTRIVSHAFDMGDWRCDQLLELNGAKIYKWVVPARVMGVWAWEGLDGTPYCVELRQKYQDVTGSAWIADQEAVLNSAELHGGSLELTIQGGDPAALRSFTLDFADGELQSVVQEHQPAC